MKQLEKDDLARFSWENMSHGIHAKVKRKRNRLFVFRIFRYALILLGLIACIKYFSCNQEHSITQPSYSNNNLSKDEIDSRVQVSAETADDDSIELSEDEAKQVVIVKSPDFNKRIILSNEVVQEGTQVQEKYINNETVVNLRKDSLRTSDNSMRKIGDILQNSPSLPFIKTNLMLNREEPVMNFKYSFDRRSETSKKDKSVTLSSNLNLLQKHPHESLSGFGFSLGYIIYLKSNHYIGFEYSYQKYRYRYNYPKELIELGSDVFAINSHKIYSLPLYYGYRFGGKGLKYSIEAGFNVALIKFSEGEVSSLSNELQIIKIAGDNIIRKDIGTSLMVRGRIDYGLSNNFGMFSRMGINYSNRNWYVDENYTLKPLLLNFDVGIYKKF